MYVIDEIGERVLGWLARFDPARREILLASLFLLLVVLVGTVGYVMLEGWDWSDGLYMTFITLTTIGFGEVQPLSHAGRFFTIVIALVGIGSVAFIATRSAQLLISTQHFRERHNLKKLQRMDDHYVLCGYGRIGKRIAQDLRRSGHAYVVIDHDEDEIEELREDDVPYVYGNAEDEEILVQASIERARCLILTLPEDSANVFVTLMARELNPDIFILARTNDHKNMRKLRHAGADKVISPDEIGADRMAQVILRPSVDRFMEQVLRTGALGLLMDEVTVHPHARLAGKSLAESNFRQQFDAVVIAIIDGKTDEMNFNPSPQDKIDAGDVLIVLGSQEMIRRLRQEGCSSR